VQPERKQRTGSAGKKPRPTRCMKCATCLRPSLKKACLRNKALRSQGLSPGDDAPPWLEAGNAQYLEAAAQPSDDTAYRCSALSFMEFPAQSNDEYLSPL
jgi:hypothetical protein